METKKFQQTLADLDRLVNSETIKTKSFRDFKPA